MNDKEYEKKNEEVVQSVEKPVEKPEKKYNDLGSMIADENFSAFIKKMTEYEGTEDLTILQEHQHGLPSELDEILLKIPKYLLKKSEDKIEYYEGALEALDILLKNGANPNAVFKNGKTPFMAACEIEKFEVVKKLIDNPLNPANIEQGDGMGNRPLMYATLAEATEVMDFLVKECNVNMDFQYILSHQQTVFHYACGQALEKSVDKLIELGANPLIRDNFETLPGEAIPAFDEDIHEENEFEPEELEKWDQLFNKMCEYTQSYKNQKQTTKKLIF
jgi:hypothetical protein